MMKPKRHDPAPDETELDYPSYKQVERVAKLHIDRHKRRARLSIAGDLSFAVSFVCLGSLFAVGLQGHDWHLIIGAGVAALAVGLAFFLTHSSE